MYYQTRTRVFSSDACFSHPGDESAQVFEAPITLNMGDPPEHGGKYKMSFICNPIGPDYVGLSHIQEALPNPS